MTFSGAAGQQHSGKSCYLTEDQKRKRKSVRKTEAGGTSRTKYRDCGW